MSPSVKAVPQGFHTVTPSLVVRNADEAIEFYKKALGAEEIMRMPDPRGNIAHAELKIGNSMVFLSDEVCSMGNNKSPQTLGGITGALHLYVEDVDKAFQRAVDAGGKVTMPVTEMFWGDRYGQFVDPYGQMWGIGTHVKDMTGPEIAQAAKEFYTEMAKKTA